MSYHVTSYALASLAAAIVNLLLGYIVLKKRPHHPLNRVYCLLTILVGFVWPFSEFVLRSTQSPQAADFWARLAWSPVLVSTALILHVVFIMTKKRLSSADKSRLTAAYFTCTLFILLNFTTDTVVSGAHLEYWGYTGSFGWVLKNVYLVYHFAIVVLALYLLYQRYKTTGNSIEKFQIKYVSTGLFFPYIIGGFAQLFLPVLGYTPIPIASATTIVMDGFIAYAIIRYKLLVLTPTAEEDADTKPRYTLEPKTYLIQAGEDEKAMDIYVDQIIHGRQGLCATTSKPEEIRSKYKIEKTPIIWLTYEETIHRSIPPDDLEQLTLHLKDFFNNSDDNSTVLLDSIDYLIELNGFTRTYDMIKKLNKETAKTKTTLIIPIKSSEDVELIRLQLSKDDIEQEICFARKRFHKREIDEQSFREIVKEFEKQLIKLDLDMSKINKKRLGEDIEIME